MTTTPYAFIKRGNLFITPVGSSTAEAPYPTQSFTKPPEFSLWVHGEIQEPGLHMDRAQMSTLLYREVRDDLTRYAPVEVTRSAIQRSSHAYVGVIDSRGTPYYFALDSRGVSVREASSGDAAWKAFDRIAAAEHVTAVRQRRVAAASEMRRVDRELRAPALFVASKALKYGKKIDWYGDVPHSSWWRGAKRKKEPKTESSTGDSAETTEKAVVHSPGTPKSARTDLFVVAARAHREHARGDRAHAYDRERSAHEHAGGVAVGHTRIRPSHGNEAKPAAEVPHYSDTPDHVIGGPGHRVVGEPESEKPRGTTSIWRHGDDERRAKASHGAAPPARRSRRKVQMYGKSHGALYLVNKALPRKSREAEVKKTPTRKASKKVAGAGGKTRYTYPQEGAAKKRSGAGQVPLVVVHDDTKRADPAELANQLGVSVRTLQRAARGLGSDKFVTFMRSRLKTFAAKHRLDPDYWGTLYAALVSGGDLTKSDDASTSKKFGDDVNRVASAVPADHGERFGDRKVFIHHVHHEMKRHKLYSGNVDDFKRDVVNAHKNGHLTAARADLVSAMNPRSVAQSETKADGATFHFIGDVKHDPVASKKLETEHKPEISKPKLKMSNAFHKEVAHTMSDEAREATAHANKVGTPEAHLAAMSSHHQAGAQHQKATGKINDKAALAHFDQSTVHLKAARVAKG